MPSHRVSQRISPRKRHIDTRLTELETQLIELFSGIPERSQLARGSGDLIHHSNVLSPQLLEERGLVNGDGGHDEGSFSFFPLGATGNFREEQLADKTEQQSRN